MSWNDAVEPEPQHLGRHGYRIGTLIYTPDGRRLVAVDYTEIRVYKASTGLQRARFSAGQWVFTAALSPDGKTLAVGGEAGKHGGAPGQIRLFDLATGSLIRALKPGDDTQLVSSLEFSPDGKTLAAAIDRRLFNARSTAATRPASIQLWDVAALTLRAEFAEAASTVAFSPDGRLLAASSRDRQVRLINASDGTENATLDAAGPARFAPDGRSLITRTPVDDGILIWNLASRAVIQSIPGAGLPLTVSPDSRTLVASEGNLVVLYQIATGRKIRALTGLIYGADCAAFSPDGSALATGGGYRDEDEGVVVWRTSH